MGRALAVLLALVMLGGVVSPSMAADEVRTNNKISEKSPKVPLKLIKKNT